MKIDLTSETTSWDMSLWMAARQSWVIFGSFVPQPMRKGWTTSELFSFNAYEKRYGSSQFLTLWRIQNLLIIPINKKQSPVLEICELLLHHREERQLAAKAHLHSDPNALIPSTFSLLSQHFAFLRAIFSFQIQNVHLESIWFVTNSKVLPTPKLSPSTLLLVAFSFCSVPPQNQIQKQHNAWHKKYQVLRRKRKNKMPSIKPEEKETRMFVCWIHTPGCEFFNWCFSEEWQFLKMKHFHEKLWVSGFFLREKKIAINVTFHICCCSFRKTIGSSAAHFRY